MPRRIVDERAAVVFYTAAASFVQVGDGFVGVYSDTAGTLACASVPQYANTTLYVIAKPAGATSNGITGAEFCTEVTNPLVIQGMIDGSLASEAVVQIRILDVQGHEVVSVFSGALSRGPFLR